MGDAPMAAGVREDASVGKQPVRAVAVGGISGMALPGLIPEASNCCLEDERHSHRSPGDCYPVKQQLTPQR